MYDAKGAVLRLGLKLGQKQGVRCLRPVPQKLYQQLPKHWNMLNFHWFWIEWYQESIPNDAQ